MPELKKLTITPNDDLPPLTVELNDSGLVLQIGDGPSTTLPHVLALALAAYLSGWLAAPPTDAVESR